MASILDTVISNTKSSGSRSSARVVREEHDASKIDFGGESAIKRKVGGRPTGPWDAAEYGITLAEAQAKWDAAQTPEAREKVVAELRERALRRASLDLSNGRVNMMAAGELPWHGLGVLVDKAATSIEAIKHAGLDWLVVKTQLHYADPRDQTQRNAPGVYGIVRQDTGDMLGSVGSLYQPIQNVEAFNFLDGVLIDHGARYETAGSIFNGEKVWMLAHLPRQDFCVNGNDEIKAYAMFTNVHSGDGAAHCYPTSVRTVCANTYRTSQRDQKNGISIRHAGDMKSKMREAQAALGLAVRAMDEFKEGSEALAKKKIDVEPYLSDVLDAVLKVTQADMDTGIDALAKVMAKTEAAQELARKRLQREFTRRENVLEDILKRYESERCGINGMRGTAWAAFNAVTEHADHSSVTRRIGNQRERASRRFESTMIGDADEMKQVAYELALKA